MAKPKKTDEKGEQELDVIQVSQTRSQFYVIGATPLVCNRMSEKAKHTLLLPSGRKTATEKALILKHNPLEEYRDSPYILSDKSSPTAIAVMSTSFKGALRTAALDLPGAKKAQIGRLCYVEGDMVPIYGVPQIFMAIVRSADMNKTPDVRTRAILPQWAATFTVVSVEPLIKPQAVANLLAAAGFTAGIGDGRPEKGAMNYGQFRLCAKDDPAYLDILASGGRAAQKAAIAAPVAYDDETASLLAWFDEELGRRKQKGVAAA